MKRFWVILWVLLIPHVVHSQPDVYQEAITLAQNGKPKEGLDLLKQALKAYIYQIPFLINLGQVFQ